MTIVSDIITDAFRQSNLIAVGTQPTLAEQREAFRHLNRIVLSVFGNEVGSELTPFPLGRQDMTRPSGYPWYNNEPPAEWFVPMNAQLVCNISSPVEVYLHPIPNDGARVSVVDISKNFNTNNLTIHGNGRNIEGLPLVTLNTAGLIKTWIYREDLADWVVVTPLENLTQEFPFPSNFDMYFITLLAMHLNPAYGIELGAQAQATLMRSGRQLKAKYKNIIDQPSEMGLTRLPIVSRDRTYYTYTDYYYDPSSIFNAGRPRI